MVVHLSMVTAVAIIEALMAAYTSKDHHTDLPTATATATPGTTAIRDLRTRALNRDKLPDKLPATHLLTAEMATQALSRPLTMADSQDTTSMIDQIGGEEH